MSNHNQYSDHFIADVLRQTNSIALVGASPKPERASNSVLRYMIDEGYQVTPINPGQAGRTIHGQTVVATLNDLPEAVDMIDVFRPVTALPELFDEILALSKKPKYVWLQLAIRDDEQAGRLEADGIIVIQDRCPKIEIPRLRAQLS